MKSLRKMWPVIVLINFLLLINTYSCITQKTQCDSKNHSCALTQSSVLTRNILKWDETHTISSIDWSLLVQQNKSGDLSEIYNGFTSANISYIINSIYSDNTTILIKNSNRILATNNYEADLLRTISSRLLTLHEPFDPSKSPFASDKCHRDMAKYLSSLKNFDLWALQMYDSSAKLPPGILSGNINQFGDFDECMQATFDDNQHYIEPQYCLAYLQPEIIDGFPTLNQYHRMVQSNFMFTSNFDDPGHRVPRFSTINWAICVPASCSYKDVEQVLSDFTSNITQGTGVHLKVRVDKEMCQRPTYKISLGSKLAMIFFGIILLISVVSTFYDFNTKIQNPWFVVFSLLKNTKALFSTERAHDDIKSIHGIRFLNAIMLIMAHKSMALFYAPYVNRTGMTEILGQYWTVLGRAASLYTDPFIMISGLLTTYAFVGRLQKGNNIKIRQEYISRLIRILPPLLALIYFCTFILPLLGSGPLWNMVVTPHSELCKRNWWRNLLFIHNYFGFENMCLNHTHHVGIDTQLFVLVPFMILLLWKYPKPGATFLAGIAVLSTVGRYQITILKRLNNYVYFGTSVQSLFDTANFMYIIPPYRITVYIMGVFLGYLLRTRKGFKLTQGQLKIGWYINVLLWMAAFFGPAPMGKIDYKYNPMHAAYYAAFAPIAWCSFFGWVIFTSHLGHESGLSRFFSWKGFLVATRLSYAIYLTQFPVFFFNVGKVRHSGQYNFITQISNVHELSWIVLTSIMLTIFFETPFGNINKILFPTKRKVLQAQSLPPTNNIEVLDKEIDGHKEDKPLFCDT